MEAVVIKDGEIRPTAFVGITGDQVVTRRYKDTIKELEIYGRSIICKTEEAIVVVTTEKPNWEEIFERILISYKKES